MGMYIRKPIRNAAILAVLIAFTLLFTSCPDMSIGLGVAVDTKPPTVSIQTPAMNASVKGSFTVSGTAQDEREMKSVSVAFKSLDSQANLKVFPADYDAKQGSWTLTLDTTDAGTGLFDAAYEITVTATDASGKTSTVSSPVRVDNTAPTVMITSPTVYGGENCSKFFQQISIQGKVYDASEISEGGVKVYIVDEHGTVKAGPVAAKGTNTWSALFKEADLTALEARDAAGNQREYFFYAIATDAAGNSNSYMYHNADLYAYATNPFPSMDMIGSLDQNVITSIKEEGKYDFTREQLRQAQLDFSKAFIEDRLAAGKYYPDLYYTTESTVDVKWTNLGDVNASALRSIGKGTGVFVNLLPPSDGSGIDLSSIKCWIQKVDTSSYFTRKHPADPEDLSVYVEKDCTATSEYWEIPSDWLTKESMGGTSAAVSIPTKKEDGNTMLEGGYRAKITFKTTSSMEFTAEKVFKITSEAPIITESGIAGDSDDKKTAPFVQKIVTTKTGIEISGTATSSDLTCETVTVSAKREPSAGSDPVVDYSARPVYRLSIPSTIEDGTYTYTITAATGEGENKKESSLTRIIVVDTTPPVLTLSSPAYVDSKETLYTSSGASAVTLQGSSTDAGSGVGSTYWLIDTAAATHTAPTETQRQDAPVLKNDSPDREPVKGTWYRFNTPTVPSFTPDLSDLSDYPEGHYKVWIISYDNGGLACAMQVIPFCIDDEVPSVTAAITMDSGKNSYTAGNVTYVNGGFTLSGTVSDANGLDASAPLTVTIGGTPSASTPVVGADGSWSVHIAASELTEGSSRTVEVTGKDSVGKVNGEKKFIINLDTAAPTVQTALTSGKSVTSNAESNRKFSFEAADTGAGIPAAGAYSYVLNGAAPVTKNARFDITFNEGSGQELILTVRDNLGNENSTTYSNINVDYTDPVMTGINDAPEYIQKDGTYTFGGTFKDNLALAELRISATRDNIRVDQNGDATAGYWFQKTFTDSDMTTGGDGTKTATVTIPTFTTAGKTASNMNGLWKFTVELLDKAGRAATVSRQFTVDVTPPVITALTRAPEASVDSTSPYTFRGTATDTVTGTGPSCGLDKVEYSMDGTSWTTANGDRSWYDEIPVTQEGTGTIYVRATDLAGNVSAVQNYTYTFDSGKPAVTAVCKKTDGTAVEEFINAAFKLEGTAVDGWALDETTPLIITQQCAEINGGAAITLDAAGITWNGSAWTVTGLPRKADGTAQSQLISGTYTYTVTATDKAGKTNDATVTVKIDQIEPVVTITSHTEHSAAAGAVNPPAYQNSMAMTITGTVVEANLKSVIVQLFKKNTAVAYATEDVTNLLDRDGAFTWKKYECDEGEYYATVTATDKAGQTTAKQTTDIIIDATDPDSDVQQCIPGMMGAPDTVYTMVNGASFSTAEYCQLSGLIEDPYFDSATMTVTKDGVAVTGSPFILVENTEPSDDKPYIFGEGSSPNTYEWLWDINADCDSDDDGTYVYTLTIRDRAGNQTEHKVTVLVDNTDPDLEIKLPADGEYSAAATYTISGTVMDGGSGVSTDADAVTYELMKGDTVIASGNASVTGISWKAENIALEKVIDAETGEKSGEGELKLTVTAKDKLGHWSSVTHTLYYDKSAPSLSETGIGNSGKMTNAAFTMSGTASDTNALFGKQADGTAVGAVTITAGSGASAISRAVNVAADGTWSTTFTPGNPAEKDSNNNAKLADGEYVFTITARDVAGRTAIAQRAVTVDTTAPTITASSSGWVSTSPNTEGWYASSMLPLSVTAADEGGTGVSSVEYALAEDSATDWTADGSWEALEDSAWNYMRNDGSAFTANASIADGVHYICVRARDEAGNVVYAPFTTDSGATLAAGTIKVDTTDPSYMYTYKEIDHTAEISSRLTNATTGFDIYICVDDLNGDVTVSGVKSVVAKINSKDFSSDTGLITAELKRTYEDSDTQRRESLYKLSFTPANLAAANAQSGSKIVWGKITDNAGNSYVAKLFTLQYDTAAPSVEFTSPAVGSVINKKFTVTGKASDNQSLEEVRLLVKKTGDTEFKTLKTWNKSGAESLNNWSFEMDTFNAAAAAGSAAANAYVASKDESFILRIEAVDEAGNAATAVERTITVDQSKDQPVMQLTDIKLTGMKDGTAAWLIGSNTITGAVSDDDGITSLSYSYRQKSGAGWTAWSTAATVTVQNNLFSITLPQDNEYEIKFTIVDQESGTFSSDATNALLKPVLKGKDNTVPASASDAVLRLKVDKDKPLLGPTNFSWDGSGWDPDLLIKETVGGQTHPSFEMQQYAYDVNGIASVKVTINNVEYEASLKEGSTKVIDGKTYVDYRYTVNSTTISALASKTYTMKITVTDNAGSSDETMATFSVDNTAPEIEVTSHADGDRVNGEFTLAGTTRDAPSYSGAYRILYKVTASSTAPAADEWATVPITNYGAHELTGTDLASWRLYFDGKQDGSGYTHDKELKKILVMMSQEGALPGIPTLIIPEDGDEDKIGKVVNASTNELYKDLVTLYIHFNVSDKQGNTNTSYKISFALDPQGDIPTVDITYPAVSTYVWKAADDSVIYTKSALPSAGDAIYGKTGNQLSGTVSAVNEQQKTLTVSGTAYTALGGETVQGGIIRIQGTASDEKAVAGVYLQVDTSYSYADGFKWTDTEKAAFGDAVVAINDELTGILVGDSISWSYALNKNGELTNQDMIAIRAVSKDAQGNTSPFTQEIIINMDKDKPQIGSTNELYLYQYENNDAGTGDVTASQKYEDDMWLKGVWWLTGSVEDTNDISLLRVSDNNQTPVSTVEVVSTTDNTTTVDSSSSWVKAERLSSNKGYFFKLKVGSDETDSFGRLTYDLHAEDKDSTAKEVEKTISINFDNKAPELASAGSINYQIDHAVVQSQGFYTLGSAVMEPGSGTEDQSGFERVALYFVRPGATLAASTLYDTYFLKGDAENTIALSTLTYEQGLWWKQLTVTRDSAAPATITIASEEANIHQGGIVKIGGTVYQIIKVEYDTTDAASPKTKVTLSGSPELKYTEAGFAMALIIDHRITESTGDTLGSNGYYEDVVNDDGDSIIEKIDVKGTTAYWEANVNSRNIPDGVIEIHYVAFDKAGNYAIGVAGCQTSSAYDTLYTGKESTSDITYDYDAEDLTRVANNAPRIAGILYGTDLNGNGTVEDSELETGRSTGESYIDNLLSVNKKYGNRATGADGKYILSGSILDVKGAVRIVPEIVGGNGNLSYTYAITKNGTAAAYKEITTPVNFMKDGAAVSGTDYSGYGNADEINRDASIDISLADILANGGSPNGTDSDLRLFRVVIHDSTPGMTGGNTANLEMVMNFKMGDSAAPVTTIKPFYWKSSTENSIYKKTLASNKQVLMGHIELGTDLPTGGDAAFANTNTGVYDLDDKVSGSVVFEGTSSDGTIVKDIYVRMYSGSTPYTFPEVGADDQYTSGTTTYYRLATYNGSGWTKTSTKTFDETGWDFESVSDTFTKDGHVVEWKITVNTEKIMNGCAADVQFEVLASDRGNPDIPEEGAWDPTADDAYTPNYGTAASKQQDVVPYVVSVATKLSSSEKKNPTKVTRSALGWYPVASDEKVIVTGFNLISMKYGDHALSAKTAADVLSWYGTYATTFAELDVSWIDASGKVELTSGTGAIPTLNNKNDNEAKGSVQATLSEENYGIYAYNRQPNEANNNRLTDDVAFAVWEFDPDAGQPISGKIEQPVMKINPENDKVGFAFVNGPLYFSMGGSTTTQDYSYQYWMASYDFFTSVGFTYDAKGNSWAVAAGGDINKDQADRFVLASSVYGIGQHGQRGSYDGVNNLRLEQIAQKNGSTYDFDKQRIKSPSLATSVHGDETTLYLAYYDGMNDEIRFKTGALPEYTRRIIRADTPDSNYAGAWMNKTENGDTLSIKNGDTFYLCDATGKILDGTTLYTVTNLYQPDGDQLAFIANGQAPFPGLKAVFDEEEYTQEGDFRVINDDTDVYIHIIPHEFGDFKDQYTSATPGSYSTANHSLIVDSAGGAGQYVSLAVIPDESTGEDTVVAVWFDATARRLKYKYWTADDGWSATPVAIFEDTDSETAGEYCKVVTDNDGGVHIAAYDPTNLDLVYAYLPSSFAGVPEDKDSFERCIVDSDGIVGSNISLDVAKDGGKWIPYIGYYATSYVKPKYAYLNTTVSDGAVEDMFTGAWECMLLPTSSTIEMQSNQHNDINIGVWKNADGTWKEDYATGANSFYKDSKKSGYSSDSNGQVYGNGKKYPILGYAVTAGAKSDTIETAQMK